MRRLDKETVELSRQARKILANWDGAFGLDPEPEFFRGWEEMPNFEYGEDAFSPEMAWWLAELCRLAYTPDHREVLRDKTGKLPNRSQILSERTSFCEVHSVHKTGNHASIYRPRSGEGPTIVCFRGTSKIRQWIMNAVVRPHGWRRFRLDTDPDSAFVHSGFYVLFKRVWSQMEAELEALPRPWIFTGHSLGGALAMIAGAVVEAELVCTFGTPKVGNSDFCRLKSGRRVWRLVNDMDIVPRLPLADGRLKERQYIHGFEAMKLVSPAMITKFDSSALEDELPFSLSNLSDDIQSPPDWILDHRIGEYCSRLRGAVLARMHD
tara:strand:+ start:10637 stop:11605 length:969 start_codon:yes stop_codon:yes gene_type:complete